MVDHGPAPADSGLEDLDVAALDYAGRSRGASAAERAALRDELTLRCLPFAGRLARRYRGRGESAEDLVQVARLGLVKAIDRYDPGRGSFTAYTLITISGEIKRHFRDKTWMVHVPRRIQDLSIEVGHASIMLTGALSRTPTDAEVAERLDVTVAEVREAIGSIAGYSPASLNAPLPGDGPGELGDLLGELDHDLELVDDRLTIADLLLRLPGRERQMLAMRFYGDRSQAEIAAELGISQMHVSRLLSRALTWLREAMLSDRPPSWSGAEPPQRAGVEVFSVRSDGRVAVRIRGEVDRDNAERLRVALRRAVGVAGAEGVVLDLSGVPLVDAAGVAVLADAASAASSAGVTLALAGAQPYVGRILAVSGLSALLDRR